MRTHTRAHTRHCRSSGALWRAIESTGFPLSSPTHPSPPPSQPVHLQPIRVELNLKVNISRFFCGLDAGESVGVGGGATMRRRRRRKGGCTGIVAEMALHYYYFFFFFFKISFQFFFYICFFFLLCWFWVIYSCFLGYRYGNLYRKFEEERCWVAEMKLGFILLNEAGRRPQTLHIVVHRREKPTSCWNRSQKNQSQPQKKIN